MNAKASKRKISPLWAAAFWILVWEALSRLVDQSLLLVSPFRAAHRLMQLLGEGSFWQSVVFSLGHIVLGFLLSALLGIGLAILSYRFHWVEELLSPLTAAIKAIPVASFVILALLWVSKQNLSVLISLLIGFPVIYGNALTGLKNTDPDRLEMAKLFRVPFSRQLRALYLPSLAPYLLSSLSIAMGLCWKSGIAAEVIGTPDGSMGERLYNAKIYLETPDLFAWTIMVVLLSVICEKLLKWLLRLLQSRLNAPMKRRSIPATEQGLPPAAGTPLSVRGLTAAYGEKTVLDDLHLQMVAGGRYCVVGASGSGKTTLLRAMMGLVKPSAGDVNDFTKLLPSAVFQEDRLLDWMTAAENLRFVSDISTEEASKLLLRLGLAEESLMQPVSEFSGGMKRRVSIARALCAPYDILYLDEPYKGLDEATRHNVQAVVEEMSEGRTLILVTHDLREAEGYEQLRLHEESQKESAE